MKEQYVGDVSDYRKYALLRALSQSGTIKVGVCWMLTLPDTRSDGAIRRYLSAPDRWRHYDPDLFDVLDSASDLSSGHRLSRIEQSGILPAALFFNETVPDDALSRRAYMRNALLELADAELIFFDPDNGMDVKSVPLGRRNSSKFLYREELLATFQAGHSVLVYQHFSRQSRGQFIRALGDELAALAKPQSAWAFCTPHVVFFLLVHAKHANRLESAALSASSRWNARFLVGWRLETCVTSS